MTVVGWKTITLANGKKAKIVYGVISGTSGTSEDTKLRKIVCIKLTRVLSAYSADSLKVEPVYGGSGGSFTIRVTNVATPAEDTTTTVTVHYEVIGY